MNIGPILRGALGKSQPTEAKSLELRTGQVVKGTVLSVSDDGTEAVVEVQGVKLKAALETPLQQGQSMMMQVQPPGQDGLTVLKPLPTGTSAGGPDIQIEQLLKKAGLADTADHRELVRAMQQAGLPVTREQTEALIKTLASKPSAVSLPEWVNAAAIAVQRGLPLSGEVVSGLHQAIYGPPVHQLLASLEEQLNALLEGKPSGNGQQPSALGTQTAGGNKKPAMSTGGAAANVNAAAPEEGGPPAANTAAGGAGGAAKAAGPGMDALLQRLQSVLGELRSELAAGRGGTSAESAGNAAGANAAAVDGEAAPAAARTDSQPATGGAAGAGGTHGTESWVARVLKLLGAEHEQQAGRALLLQAAPKAAAESSPPGGAPSLRSADGGQAAGGETPAGQTPPPAAGGAQGPGAAAPAPGTVAPAQALPGQANPAPAAGQSGQGPAAQAAAQAGPGGSPAASAAAGEPAGAASGSPANPQAAADTAADNSRRGEAARSGTAAPGSPAPSAEQAHANRLSPSPGLTHAADERFAGASQTPAAGAQPAGSQPASGDDPVLALKDNLKSILLQIIDTPDAPPQLQEAARQMVQQLTGQQLLLNTDRTAPFAQVTMFLPFEGPDGEETATIQIQSRRGKKGELDPDNCRLWFDLNMSVLGKLMVDVQVADKKVILQIHSEGDTASAFLEGRQEEIGTAIQEAGYRLVAMRTDSYFSERSEKEQRVSQTGAASYAPPAYRGVDYRI